VSEALTPLPPDSFVKSCCADVWSHPGVRLLFGQALRPGGTGLTGHALELLGLPVAARVLDLGSGPGATLTLLKERGMRPVGADYSRALAAEAAAVAPSVAADAERPPFRSRSMDAVFMECVLSAVPDKRAALGEVVRLLRPGGLFALSDVVVEGPLAPPLDSFAGWLACAAGALPAEGYAALLDDAALAIEVREDHRASMSAMLAQVARRLALIRGSIRAGVVDAGAAGVDEGLVETGAGLVAAARESVEAGLLGYALFIGRSRR